jgi:hypothetical protein
LAGQSRVLIGAPEDVAFDYLIATGPLDHGPSLSIRGHESGGKNPHREGVVCVRYDVINRMIRFRIGNHLDGHLPLGCLALRLQKLVNASLRKRASMASRAIAIPLAAQQRRVPRPVGDGGHLAQLL